MAASHREIALDRAPRAQVLINRADAVMFVWRRRDDDSRYRRRKYSVGVGKLGDETPSGAYYIDAKSREPSWWIPKHPDYAPELWGEEIPYDDPRNPFAGGFLSISGGEGVGIHGVRFDPELKSTGGVSHGCIRVAEPVLYSLYDLLPLGTPVIIL